GGPAGEDLLAVREGGDPGRLVDALAREILADLRGAGGVEPDPDLGRESGRAAMLGQAALDRDGTPERLVRRVEPDEEAVAGRDDLFSLELGEQTAQRLVVPAQDALPRIVAQRFHQVGRPLDVGEHEGLLDAARAFLAA